MVLAAEYVVHDEDTDETGSGFVVGLGNGVGSWVVKVGGDNGVAWAQKRVSGSMSRVVLDDLLPAETYRMEEWGDVDDEKLEDEVWNEAVDALAMAAAGRKPVAAPTDVFDDGVLDHTTSGEIPGGEVWGWGIGCGDVADEIQDDLQDGSEGGLPNGVQSHEEDKNCTMQAQALIHVAAILPLDSTFLTFSGKDSVSRPSSKASNEQIGRAA